MPRTSKKQLSKLAEYSKKSVKPVAKPATKRRSTKKTKQQQATVKRVSAKKQGATKKQPNKWIIFQAEFTKANPGSTREEIRSAYYAVKDVPSYWSPGPKPQQPSKPGRR